MNKSLYNKGTSLIDNLLKEAANDPNAQLILNLPQPVVGVKVDITGRLKTKSGEIPLSYLTLKYNWMKCTRTLNCSLPRCCKATINEPLRLAKFRCLLCYNEPGASRMIFCSNECLQYHLRTCPHNNVKKITTNLRDWCDDIISLQAPDLTSSLKYIPISNTDQYIPTNDDAGKSIRVEVTAFINGKEIASRTLDTLMTYPRGPSPQPRMYLSCKTKPYMTNPIRLASYNILASVYCSEGCCPHCPDWARQWNYRRDNIIRDLTNMSSDIICLQEVQFEHYKDFIKPELEKRNYSGLYKQKTRDGLEDKIDGCAIFYKSEKFDLINKDEINFNDLARESFQNDYSVIKRLLHDNVAQIVHFRYKYPGDTSSDIIVANTHIYWDPDYPDVKLWQTYKLLQRLENYTPFPIILCGDFNSTLSSAVYTFLTESCVASNHPELKIDPLKIIEPLLPLKHSLSLQSVYKTVLGNEPQTNYTANFKGSLDYIFYTPGIIQPFAVLNVPTESDLMNEIGSTELPNPVYPSDHIPLCMEFDVMPQVMPPPNMYMPSYY